MDGITQAAPERFPSESGSYDDARDRRGATGLINGLAISVVMWVLIALAIDYLTG